MNRKLFYGISIKKAIQCIKLNHLNKNDVNQDDVLD